jgi:hypothetical protein
MWASLTGSIVDVNKRNGVVERLAADFVGDASAMTLDATTTEFVGPGTAPHQVHWQADGQGWVLLAGSTSRIPAGDDDHDFLDLPKLLWPRRYAPLAEACEGSEPTVILSRAGAQLLGNGVAHRVVVAVDRGLGVIRSYRSEATDGTTLRTVELALMAR